MGSPCLERLGGNLEAFIYYVGSFLMIVLGRELRGRKLGM